MRLVTVSCGASLVQRVKSPCRPHHQVRARTCKNLLCLCLRGLPWHSPASHPAVSSCSNNPKYSRFFDSLPNHWVCQCHNQLVDLLAGGWSNDPCTAHGLPMIYTGRCHRPHRTMCSDFVEHKHRSQVPIRTTRLTLGIRLWRREQQ